MLIDVTNVEIEKFRAVDCGRLRAFFTLVVAQCAEIPNSMLFEETDGRRWIVLGKCRIAPYLAREMSRSYQQLQTAVLQLIRKDHEAALVAFDEQCGRQNVAKENRHSFM
ncbi:MAG: hypothetical protein WBR26_27765 [Candidatus Acidiferrum sp.]